MTQGGSVPPRLAEQILEASLAGSEWRDVIVGDLREEYAARVRTGAAQPAVWYWREALRLALHFGFRQLSRLRSRRTTRAEHIRSARKASPMINLRSDVRFSLRTILKRPGFALVVGLTLALGLGVNATVLGMMDAMILRPFQFPDYERIVVLRESVHGRAELEAVAPADFLDWRRDAGSYERLAAWEWWNATLTEDDPERIPGVHVSPGFFEAFGSEPVIGRSFTRDEEQPGSHRSVILGDGLWRRRFGADVGIVGREIRIEGELYTVVGIAPTGFAFPTGSQIWAPLAMTPERAADRKNHSLTVAGKLAADETVATAQVEIDLITRRLQQQYPETNRDRAATVQSLSNAFREDVTGPLLGTLEAVAALVLIVACANIAGLLLARSLDRQREFAVRAAVGATRWRIARQLVVETVALGLLASILALVFAGLGLDLLRTSLPADAAAQIEGWENLHLDRRLILLMPAVSIGVGLLVGLIPALAASRANLTVALKDSARGTIGGGRSRWGRQALVVGEIAVALALLITAGITLGGGAHLASQPGGFEAQGLLALQIPLPDNKYGAADARREFTAELLAGIDEMPSVEGAAVANILPASGWNPTAPVLIEDYAVNDAATRPRAGIRLVSPSFFETMHVPIVTGRGFFELDREDSEPVAIVSELMADRFWPGQDPIGRRLRLEGAETEWLTIVGVAGDVRMYNWWDGENSAAVYLPLRQVPPEGTLAVAVRAPGDAIRLTNSVRRVLGSIDPLLPIENARTMEDAIAESSRGLAYISTLIAICGIIALALSIAGIYSVMAHSVSQRTHEFGVRLAVGASSGDLVTLALRQAALLTAAGVALGVVLAVGLGRLLSSALFGLLSLDASTFVVVSLGLAVVSLSAAALPTRRYLRLDPAAILRSQ